MIMPWNRKDVFSSNDMEELRHICSLLEKNDIKYGYIVSPPKFPLSEYGYKGEHSYEPPKRGLPMANGMDSVEYDAKSKLCSVYVHKNDYDEAMHIIHSQK